MGKSSRNKRRRSYEEEEQRLIKKLKKVQRKRTRQRSRGSSSVSSDGEIEIIPQLRENEQQSEEVNENKDPRNEKEQNIEKEPEIGEEILEVFGKDPSVSQAKEHPIHSQIGARWNVWLSEGLPKDEKNDILSKYVRKGQLEAPILNPEVVASMNESATKRDKHFLILQNTLGSAIAALGAGTSCLLPQKDFPDKIKTLEYFSDAGKILTDLHHSLSLARKAFISPGLPKQTREVLESVKTDTLLYGEKLSERIKESHSIEKLGQNMKVQETNKKPVARNAGYLNRSAPPSRPNPTTTQGGYRKAQTRFPFQPRNNYQNKPSYPSKNRSPTRARSAYPTHRHRR